jgi:hypothetical protein
MGAGVIEVTTRNGMSSRKELNLHGVDKARLGISVRMNCNEMRLLPLQ